VLGKKTSSRKAIIAEIESELVENAKEANRQRQCMERTSENLEHRLRVIKTETERVNRTRLNENSHLIFECNNLRRDLKNVQRKLDIANQQCNELKRTNKKLASATTAPLRWPSKDSGDISPFEQSPSSRGPPMKLDSFMEVVNEVVHEVAPPPKPLAESQSAIELGSADDLQGGTGSGPDVAAPKSNKKVHVQSAPNFFEDDLSARSNQAGKPLQMNVTNSRVNTTGNGSPIGDTTLRESMTVEQRLLRKKDTAIERLVEETTVLAAQLDESNREKAMQRTELTRLRSIIANVIQTAPPLTGTKTLKKIKNPNERVLLTVGMNNATRITSSNTNADFTGYPSQEDLSNMSAAGSALAPGNQASKIFSDDDSQGSMGKKQRQVKVPVGAGFDMRKNRQGSA